MTQAQAEELVIEIKDTPFINRFKDLTIGFNSSYNDIKYNFLSTDKTNALIKFCDTKSLEFEIRTNKNLIEITIYKK